MNRFVKVGLLMVLVLALFGTYRFVSAQERESGQPTSIKAPENIVHEQPPPVLATNHVVKETYINHAELSFGIFFPGGFFAIDSPTSISCPAPVGKTCTVVSEMTVQAGFGSLSGDVFTLCTQVDGSFPSSGCPTGGPLNNSGWTMYTWTQTVSGVAKGTHTVQSFLDTINSGQTGDYHVNYVVYLP